MMLRRLTALIIPVALTCNALAAEPVAKPAGLTPPAAMELEGVPPIPAAVAEEANRYTEFRAASLAAWHPHERQMLIRTRFGSTLQLHQVAMPMGARKQITFFQEPVGSADFPPGPGNFHPTAIYFTKDVGGNEFAQIFKMDTNGDVSLLTDGTSRNSSPIFTKDGTRFVYTSTRRDKQNPDFYVATVDKPTEAKMVFQANAPGWGPSDWSPDGTKLVGGKFTSANESALYLFDIATGKSERLSPPTPHKSKFSGGTFSAEGLKVYCTTDMNGEFEQLATIDVLTREVKILTPDLKWDVEDYALSDNGKLLAYTTNEDGLAVLHLMDTATGKEVPLPKLPPGEISRLSWHRNNRDLGLVINSAKAPSDVFSLDVVTGQVTRWTESETAGLDTNSFPDPTLVRWKSFDDRQISGFLYKPDATKFPGKRPVIINIHGGPESQFRPGFMGAYNYYFTKLGVAAIFPNVRGSSGYGKTFLTLDDGFKREDSVKDIGALLDWIKTQPDLDADRIMVTGGSYGGYMSLAVSTHYADRIRCSIDVVGISNFVTFLEKTEAYRRDLRRVEYGDERDPAMRKFQQEIAPLSNVAKIKKPMFVIHGANDPRVPVAEAKQIVSALKQQGTPVWSMVAADEGHGFGKKPNQQYQFYATIAYIREYLLK